MIKKYIVPNNIAQDHVLVELGRFTNNVVWYECAKCVSKIRIDFKRDSFHFYPKFCSRGRIYKNEILSCAEVIIKDIIE